MILTYKMKDNKKVAVYSEWVGNTLWFHAGGKTWAVEPENTQSKRKNLKNQSLSPLDIKAPMPGRITKILFQKDDFVQEGQGVVMMEAMKMEYTLKSEVNGVIKELLCQVGQQVSLGELVIKMESKNES